MNAIGRLAGTGVLAAAWACGASVDAARERAELLETERAFARAAAEERLEGWVRYFAAGGTMIQPGRLVTGRDAIGEFMAPAFADSSFSITWEPTEADVGAGGDLGYTVGRYEVRSADAAGKVSVRVGTYLTVWRKQPDGSWKVVLDQGTPDP